LLFFVVAVVVDDVGEYSPSRTRPLSAAIFPIFFSNRSKGEKTILSLGHRSSPELPMFFGCPDLLVYRNEKIKKKIIFSFPSRMKEKRKKNEKRKQQSRLSL
jgi:hypothetical protein